MGSSFKSVARRVVMVAFSNLICLPAFGAVYTLADVGTPDAVALSSNGIILTKTSIIKGGISTPLGLPAGAPYYTPTGINASGQVVGYGGTYEFHYGSNNYLLSNGVFTNLGSQSDALNPKAPARVSINNVGVITGLFNGSPALRIGNTVTTINSSITPMAINNANLIAGQAGYIALDTLSTTIHASVYDGVATIRLGDTHPFYGQSIATAINDTGHVAGYVYGNFKLSGFPYVQPEAALWINGVITLLGTLTPSPFIIQGPITEAHAINNLDQVVGVAAQGPEIGGGGPHIPAAFLYSNGILSDLNTLIPAGTGFTLQDAVGINDAGLILVNGVDGNNQPHSFLLTPTPEPATLSLLTLTSVGLLSRRRNRQ